MIFLVINVTSYQSCGSKCRSRIKLDPYSATLWIRIPVIRIPNTDPHRLKIGKVRGKMCKIEDITLDPDPNWPNIQDPDPKSMSLLLTCDRLIAQRQDDCSSASCGSRPQGHCICTGQHIGQQFITLKIKLNQSRQIFSIYQEIQ